MKVKKKKKSFPDMSGDGKITKKDILIANMIDLFQQTYNKPSIRIYSSL